MTPMDPKTREAVKRLIEREDILEAWIAIAPLAFGALRLPMVPKGCRTGSRVPDGRSDLRGTFCRYATGDDAAGR